MRRMIQRVLWFCFRIVFRLRYKVRVIGEEKLENLEGGTLVLPNHSALVDPPLVLAYLHRRYRGSIRPVAFTGSYRNPVFFPFMLLINAKEVPDLSKQSQKAQDDAKLMIDEMTDDLEQGETFLLYPSGRLQRWGEERVGAARSTSDLLQRCDDVNIVLVRTHGLWGSRFGRSQTGDTPNMTTAVIRAIWTGLTNLVFFMPRREVTIKVDVLKREDLPDDLSRESLNPWLDKWYNQDLDGIEEPIFVPYHFLFRNQSFEFHHEQEAAKVDASQIPIAVQQDVNSIIEDHLGRPLTEEENDSDTPLDRIGLDSLDRMAVALEIERRTTFRSDQVAETLGQLWALAAGLISASDSQGNGQSAEKAPDEWLRKPPAGNVVELLGETIPEAFVRRALKSPKRVAAADELSGVLTYRRLLTAALLFSKRLDAIDGKRIGVMLPASIASDIVFLGLHLSGKLPVMINFTTGPANMNHAVKSLGVTHVLTSRKFVDRLQIEIEGAEYVFIEDIRAQIGKAEAIRTLLSTILCKGRIIKRLPKIDPSDPAVVLFTSGSDAAPKAVPLSHRNMIQNIGATYGPVNLASDDILLSFLPPFHSFGLTIATVLPLLLGVRIVHHANPTDARTLARLSRMYRPTIVAGTPTLLSYMLEAGSTDDFTSYRMMVAGGEKIPDAMFELAQRMAPDATVVEGYGITECSPLISGNFPGVAKKGSCGHALENLELRVINPDTMETVPTGETGMLLVHGPSVFSGYIDYDGPSPLVELDGKTFYKTGDLVALDDDGFIFFRGRLKRFLKIGGEMVSLPALEEPFGRIYPPSEDGPRIAVEGTDKDGGRQIVLFTTFEISLKEANTILTDAGFHGIMRLDAVRQIEEIPVLGTGKTDYKVLRKEIES